MGPAGDCNRSGGVTLEQACLAFSVLMLLRLTPSPPPPNPSSQLHPICACNNPLADLLTCFVVAEASSSAEGNNNRIGQGSGSASPRLGRSSSVGMGSGESQSSGRGPTWSQMPRSHGSRVTARIPSWLHLPSLGQSAMYTLEHHH